jgi:hypothetical protein
MSELQLQISPIVVVAIDEFDRRAGGKQKSAGTSVPLAYTNEGLATAEMFFHEQRGDKRGGQAPTQPISLTSLNRRRGVSTPATENIHRLFPTIGIPRYGFMATTVRMVLFSLMFSISASFNYFCETIDRIVAVVNNQIITLSDLEKEERFYQLDHQVPYSNKGSSAEEKVIQRELVERMIEKLLLSEQVLGFPGSKITDDEIETQLNALQEKWGGKDSLDQVLVRSHTTREELKEHLRWQILVLKYVDNRFRQFTVIDPAEITTYYQKMLIPELERKGIRQFPPQSEVEAKIREILTEEKVNQAIEEWLASLKETANIHIFE